ncbi:MAG: hypothetical protein ACKVK6_01785 [bacterium]
MPDVNDAVDDSGESDRETDSFVQEHPIAMVALAVAMVGGAIAGYVYFSEMLSPVRATLGGAVAGFNCWLLVMMGRVIGD